MTREATRVDGSAIVLTGGKSSRMGRPKALLLFDGEPLILHLVRTLGRLFAEIVVVAAPGGQFVELSSLLCSRPNQPEVILVSDEVAHQGPVGGMYYGLKAAKGGLSFITSCDVPFLNLTLISYLISQISNYDVVVPYWEGRFQPLCAVYRKSVVPRLQEQLERGELRPIFLYEKVRTCKVAEDEIRRFDPEGLSFLNMNTPEDYQAALRRREAVRQVSNPGLTCTVELFGVARLRARTAEVSLELPPDATLAYVFLALAERLPTLVGAVIGPEKNSLASGHACNINGRHFVRNPNVKVNPGDRIFIVSADAGG